MLHVASQLKARRQQKHKKNIALNSHRLGSTLGIDIGKDQINNQV